MPNPPISPLFFSAQNDTEPKFDEQEQNSLKLVYTYGDSTFKYKLTKNYVVIAEGSDILLSQTRDIFKNLAQVITQLHTNSALNGPMKLLELTYAEYSDKPYLMYHGRTNMENASLENILEWLNSIEKDILAIPDEQPTESTLST